MITLTINDSLNGLLHELAFESPQEVIEDALATEILSRISSFREEIRHFEAKYGRDIAMFKRQYESEAENFEHYDDLMAWEFADQGLNYWQTKMKELRGVFPGRKK